MLAVTMGNLEQEGWYLIVQHSFATQPKKPVLGFDRPKIFSRANKSIMIYTLGSQFKVRNILSFLANLNC